MKALYDIVEQGVVKYIGCSTILAAQFAKMQFIVEKHDWFKFVNCQSCYNLLYRKYERDLIPLVKIHEMALTP